MGGLGRRMRPLLLLPAMSGILHRLLLLGGVPLLLLLLQPILRIALSALLMRVIRHLLSRFLKRTSVLAKPLRTSMSSSVFRIALRIGLLLRRRLPIRRLPIRRLPIRRLWKFRLLRRSIPFRRRKRNWPESGAWRPSPRRWRKDTTTGNLRK